MELLQGSNAMAQESPNHDSPTVESPSQTAAATDIADNETLEDDAIDFDPSQLFSDVDEGELESETESIAPELFAFEKENGRTYHAEHDAEHDAEREDYRPYWAPNDEREKERMDMSYHLWNLVLERPFLSPVQNPHNILDLGTGTGIWAIDVADEHPSAQVRGTDITPIQPTWVPPNLIFTIDNFNRCINGSWNFIHARELMGSVRDWPKLISESFQALETGGWLELAECSVHFHGEDLDLVLKRWANTMIEAGKKNDMPFDICGKLEGWMKEAGFIDVVKETYHVPVGKWPADPKQREVGKRNWCRLYDGLESYCLRPMIRFLGMDYYQAQLDICSIRSAFKNIERQPQQVTQEFIIVYGKKPMILEDA